MDTTNTPPLAVPQPAQLTKRGSLTPSIRKFLTRYPPAIIDDTAPPSPVEELSPISPPLSPHHSCLASFDLRFPQGYKIADATIPLRPDEVPSGYESLFSPSYFPVCKQLFWLGFLCPFLWLVGGWLVIRRRIQLNATLDPKLFWARVQWLKLNARYGVSSVMAFLILLLVIVIIVLVIKANARP